MSGRELWKEFRKDPKWQRWDAKRLYGLCDRTERVILFREGMSRRTRRYVVMHELLHVFWPAAKHPTMDAFELALIEAETHL